MVFGALWGMIIDNNNLIRVFVTLSYVTFIGKLFKDLLIIST